MSASASRKDTAASNPAPDTRQADSHAPLADEVFQGLASFRSAMRHFLSFSETVITGEGITSQQYQTLLIIRTEPDHAITIKDLAAQMLLQPHGAVQLVDRLAAIGLVTRTKSRLDGRSVIVSMTDDGGALLEKLASHHLHEMLRHEPLLAESLRRLRRLGKVAS